MARIRSIKPEFHSAQQIIECSQIARLLFLSMWNFCDDEGVHKFSAKQLKAEIFPADSTTDTEILGMIDELIKNGLLIEYSADGSQEGPSYLAVTGWFRQQRIDKPRPSIYPKFTCATQLIRGCIDECSWSVRRPFVSDRIRYDTIGEDLSCAQEQAQEVQSTPEKAQEELEAEKLFDEFWDAYPRRRRKNKRIAREKWLIACRKAEPALLVSKCREYAESDEGQGEFVRMPATWLNNEAWDEDPEVWRDVKQDSPAEKKNGKPGPSFIPTDEDLEQWSIRK
tara:strand:- start:965 stop:1810 length:846 start_codon:yes stop_codon:yes gene_type:complete